VRTGTVQAPRRVLDLMNETRDSFLRESRDQLSIDLGLGLLLDWWCGCQKYMSISFERLFFMAIEIHRQTLILPWMISILFA
jgi:hypothetical protein